MSIPRTDSISPFREHLVELRARVIRCIAVLAVAFGVSYNYAVEILGFLTRPLQPYLGTNHLVYQSLADGFFLFFKVGMIAALIASSPFVLYQLFMFMAPGLYPQERRVIGAIIAIGFASFLTGFTMLYRLFLPLFFAFFSRFIFDFYELYPNAGEYLDFVLRFNLYAGVLFMIPFAIFTATLFEIIPLKRFLELRRGVIILAFVIAMMITPPDVVSQIVLAAIIIALFELGLLASRLNPVLRKLLPRRPDR